MINPRYQFKSCLAAAMMAFAALFGVGNPLAAQDPPAPEDGIEVLTRGPVHEAFAQTITFDPQAGVLAPKAPPEPIEELPPDQRPEGANVDWIPGYWAWDDERDDFLWVSGIWRVLPPGRQWIPGYWAESGNTFQWTSGYWADAELTENEYLPEPPATVEAGPNIAAPSANHIWTPGCWMWNQNRYAWRPGYWIPAQQNWTWVPAHYLWSPRGYVFCNGYYDYSVARRGVIFAPVYFNANVYGRRGFRYSPGIAINLGVFGNSLFLRPNYGHYYFGDYYGSRYANSGFHPWFSFNNGRNGYDPFFAHQRWQNRQNPGWATNIQVNFQRRVDNESARPSRTFAAQQARVKSGDKPNDNDLVVAEPLSQLAKSKDSSLRFQPVAKDEQQALAKHGQEVNQFRTERQKLEVKGKADASADSPTKEPKSAKLKIPKSPFVAKASDPSDKELVPPKAQDAPEADPKVEAKPRRPGARPDSPKGEPKVPKADPKPETPKGKPKAEPKPDPKPAPKAEPKPEPKPLPKAKPNPEKPRVEPKPIPKPEPKPLPKVEPKPAPKPVVPKVEPKPTPKVAPTPAPKAGPKPGKPKGEPKPVPKEKSKDNSK